MPRLQVGDRVVLRSSYRASGSPMAMRFAGIAFLQQQLRSGSDGGCLSPGDVGEITAVDGSSLPYLVQFGSREHWYPEDALDRYVPRGVQVTAYEVEFGQRTWWYADKALQKHQASETPVEAGLSVGDYAVLSRDYQKFPDAVKGPLWPGAVGKIVAYHVEVDGRTWWYDKSDKEVLVNYVGRANLDKPKAGLSVGDKVVLSENYQTFPDAEHGPLAEGDVGTVLECDRSHLPYLVEFGSSIYWYAAGAIEKQVAKPARSGSEATTADTASPTIKVGDLVRVSPAVTSPRHGWGDIDHSMVGTVIAEGGDSLWVQFPCHPCWHGRREEMEKVARDDEAAALAAVPSIPSGPVRVVVTDAGASDLNGTYVQAGRDWNGKPLYEKEGAKGLYCYYSAREGQAKGWNLGPGTTASWVYFAPGELRVPPTTGWTSKAGSDSGLPTVALTSALQASSASATTKASEDSASGSESDEDSASGSGSDEESAESDSEASEQEELRACGECGQEGNDGWTSYDDYYCINCWAGWLSPAPRDGGGRADPAPGGEEGTEASHEEHDQEQAAPGAEGKPPVQEEGAAEEAGGARRGGPSWRWRRPRWSLCGPRRAALLARAAGGAEAPFA